MASANKETVIPDKLYFKIGEVAQIIGVKPYVLRYWETEFSDIAPSKSRTKQRLYKRKDVERILTIRDLLYRERYTINGAIKRLKELDRGARAEESKQQLPLFETALDKTFLKSMKADLESLLVAIKEEQGF